MTENRGRSGGFTSRLVTAMRPKSKSSKSRTKLTKRQQPSETSFQVIDQHYQDVYDSGKPPPVPPKYLNPQQKPAASAVDKQTGERKDHTELLHGIGTFGSSESLLEDTRAVVHKTTPEQKRRLLQKIPAEVWARILTHLTLSDAASLAFSCKTLRNRVGKGPWKAMRGPENKQDKIEFLLKLDKSLPDHLLCFICVSFHLRTQRGQESLKPANVLNPLYKCPRATDQLQKQPRLRIAPGRTLPFTFVQLATRADRYTPAYGIAADSLSRRWRHPDGEWTHQSRYHVHNGHLLVRVISQCFAPPGLPPSGERLLLYWPNDWTPYFSVCAHWRDGELMDICKCALSHIPKPVDTSGPAGIVKHVANRLHVQSPIVTLCGRCQLMRRCPQCPTEYLVQVKLAEDRSDRVQMFKHAIVVTRWSDLGDGTSPRSPEWAACCGEAEYDSFKTLGKRAISGIFESHFTAEHIPGQRILSLNPKNERKGEAGNRWY